MSVLSTTIIVCDWISAKYDHCCSNALRKGLFGEFENVEVLYMSGIGLERFYCMATDVVQSFTLLLLGTSMHRDYRWPQSFP